VGQIKPPNWAKETCQTHVQASADKTGEAVVASSLFDSVLLKLPLRIREVTCSTEGEVTNLFAAV
jgi:hypothetical protein